MNHLKTASDIISKKAEKILLVEGTVSNYAEVPKEFPLFAYMKAGDKIVAEAAVKKDGSFSMKFQKNGKLPTHSLFIAPETKTRKKVMTGLMNMKVLPQQFHCVDDVHPQAELTCIYKPELKLPESILERLRGFRKRFTISGEVWRVETDDDGNDATVDPILNINGTVPGLKLELFEVDYFSIIGRGTLEYNSDLIGTEYTNPEGRYSFSFSFGTLWPYLFNYDKYPDLKIKVSQFVDSDWVEIFETPLLKNVTETNKEYDILIPEACFELVNENIQYPEEGFAFYRIGRCALDNTSLQAGYLSSDEPSGPIAGLHHQPLTGLLHFYGMFAQSEQVTKYKFQYAESNINGDLLSEWTDCNDPLGNRYWSDAEEKSIYQSMGPDADNYYINIDNDQTKRWNMIDYKYALRSNQMADGYYAFRMVWQSADGSEGIQELFDVLRIDNTVPDCDLTINGVLPCGKYSLNQNREIEAYIKAWDSEGHVEKVRLSLSRGGNNPQYITLFEEQRDQNDDQWNGIRETRSIPIPALPQNLAGCADGMAYNFELKVWGSGTDGRARILTAQYSRDETNCWIEEPTN